VLTFHEACIGMAGRRHLHCGSSDAGASWKLIRAIPSGWQRGSALLLLDNRHLDLGIAKPTAFMLGELGARWTVLLDARASVLPSHLQGAGLYRAKNGVFYVAAGDAFFEARRQDLDDHEHTNPIGGGLASDVRRCLPVAVSYEVSASGRAGVSQLPETDGVTWTLMPSGRRSGWAARLH